ncbi:MAG: DsbA family protein [Deltaproteobacteria bacterium]|nr:DsbA family protein [Deltaproteobacteria bacterium]
MDQIVEIFYSFHSPYCYFAIDRLWQIGQKFDARVIWQPYSSKLAGQGYQGNMPEEMASYVREDSVRLAKKLGLRLVLRADWPQNEFDADKSIRGALVASDMNILYEYNIKMFQRWWAEGEDPNEQSFLVELCDDLDIDPNEFSGKMNSSDVRERVRGCFKRGKKLGVFDVPTIIIGEERFHGMERIEAAEERLTEMGLRKA